jgi:hypothetical protein
MENLNRIIDLSGRKTLQTIACLPAHYSRDIAWAIKGRTAAADRRTLVTPSALAVNIGGQGHIIDAQMELDINVAANWDTTAGTDYSNPANRAGKDLYAYAVRTGISRPDIILSANSTVPTGFSAANSRKIAGFHGLCANAGVISNHPLTGFLTGDILPETVWDILFRPICTPEGMFYVPGTGWWVDIYLASQTGASTRSAYGATISDTRDWNSYVDDFAAVGKRLLDDWLFQVAFFGSNEETNIAGSADPVTTGGHSDTAGRRMISYYGGEDGCGAMWQWLLDQSYRLDFDGTVSDYGSGATIYHAASPGGNQVYLKYDDAGNPYLCSNLATAQADKIIAFGSYKVVVRYDAAAATGGLPVYFKDSASQPSRLLVNNTRMTAADYIRTNNPVYLLQVAHDAAAATNGRALYFDDGADNRFECNNIGAANAVANLANLSPSWAYYDLPGSKGSLNRQGSYGDVKLLAGGSWTSGTNCGSRARAALYSRWYTASVLGARGCARSRRTENEVT